MRIQPVRSYSEKLSEIGALIFILGSIFIFLSLLTYDERDLPEVRFPPQTPAANMGGKIGARIAYLLFSCVGVSAYVLVGLFGLWAFAIIFRRKRKEIYIKLACLWIFVLALSTLLSIQPFFTSETFGLAGTAPSPGGVYGKAFEIMLRNHLGELGAYLVILLVICVSVILSTDLRVSNQLATVTGFMRGVLKGLRLMAPRGLPRLRLPKRSTPSSTLKQHIDTEVKKFIPREPKREPKQTGISPTLESPYQHPPVELFEEKVERVHVSTERDVAEKVSIIQQTLESFEISAKVVRYDPGPTVTIYELELAPGIKYSRVLGLTDDLAIALKAPSVRIIAPLPGKSTIGVEVPNPFPDIVRIREFLKAGYPELRRIPLPLLLGKTNGGAPIVKSLTEMPHLLIAGTTGSGKSVCLASIITSLVSIMSPQEMKLLLVDPKMVELSVFKDIPHLWSPVITDTKKVPSVFSWLIKEMEDRYTLLHRAQVRKIEYYNQLGEKRLKERFSEKDLLDGEAPVRIPYIVVIVDELADLMNTAAREVEYAIMRLSQKSRAVGIHLVIATQRPSVDVITGLIKSNMPARIAFKVAAKVDSRIILDQHGAERLLGKGDMLLLLPGDFTPIRGQCTYISEQETQRVSDFLRSSGKPGYHKELLELDEDVDIEGTEKDELFEDAVRIILEAQRGSVSLLQRRLGIGYPRAARFIDLMAKMGLVGEYKGGSAREVLMTLEQWESKASTKQ
jgi:S-DNA-T family DNA segregation ATPase FtsK/SpoIIIE